MGEEKKEEEGEQKRGKNGFEQGFEHNPSGTGSTKQKSETAQVLQDRHPPEWD